MHYYVHWARCCGITITLLVIMLCRLASLVVHSMITGETYVATYHPHPIIEKSSTVVYTEIDQNDTRRYQLNPRYT